MPYILIECCDTTKVLEQMNITVNLHYRKDFYRSKKQIAMQAEIKEVLEAVAAKYFDEFESENMSNWEYNRHMENPESY